MSRRYSCYCKRHFSPPESSCLAVQFDYLHKKQSGGSGQYGRVIGDLVPQENLDDENVFSNETIGQNIPPEYIPAIEKGFVEACAQGGLIDAPVTGVQSKVYTGWSH